jgi:hypothetical protein
MSDREETRGGFHFGNVSRDVQMRAGGDIVGGDKTTTTAVQHGFQSEEQKQEFQNQLDALRAALREIKGQVEASVGLSADEKDDLAAEILQHVQALRDVKETTAEVPLGQKPSTNVSKMVESSLDKVMF